MAEDQRRLQSFAGRGGHVETAIGVFASRDRAEQAVGQLRRQGVPEQSLVFLTRSKNEAETVGKEFGAYVGGFVGGAAGMSAGVVAATLLLPGIGPVIALGFGAAALLGLAGAGAGSTVGSAVSHDAEAPKPTPDEKCSEDIIFFREVLKEGRSLAEVQYIDSSGVGELVKAHTTIRNQAGELKLTNLNKRVHDLLQMTRLSAVFDIQKDEASAIESFGGHASSQSVA